MSFPSSVLISLLPLMLEMPSTSLAAIYAIADLGTLGGSSSDAFGINAGGQVVGHSATANSVDEHHAFLYSNGKMRDLGTLGGSESVAFGINAKGQIAGVARAKGGKEHAFYYADGKMTDLGTLGGAESLTGSINANGDVVGSAQTADGKWHAFMWRKGKMSDLGTFGGAKSSAGLINDKGLVVISRDTAHWCFWTDGKIVQPAMSPPFYSSGADAINANGDVVGGGDMGGRAPRAFLYSRGKVNVLGVAPGFDGSGAYGINARGEAVGVLFHHGDQRAFYYGNGRMTDLNTMIDPAAGWFDLIVATAINDSGWIVGSGHNPSGKRHAFLLRPNKVARR